MVFKNIYYLIIFFLFSIFYHFNLPLFEFLFLVPIFLYLFNKKKFTLKEIFYFSIFIFILSLINFYYLYGYGLKFMIILGIANVLFYLIFFLISQKLFSQKYYLYTIPSVFIILFYIFSQTILNNFWINYLVVLKYFPISIRYFGEYFNLFLIILFNLIIFDFFKYKFKKKLTFKILAKKIPKLNYFILGILIFNFFIFSTFFFTNNYPLNEKIKISGIQGNLDQNWFERNQNYEKNLNLYLNLSNKAVKNFKPQIIIWPEYTFTHPLHLDLLTLKKLNSFSINNNLSLIVGSILLENTSSNYSKRYDTLYVFKNNSISYYNSYEPVTLFDKEVISAKNNPIFKLKSINYGLTICYEEDFSYIYSNLVNKDNATFFIHSGNLYYIKSKLGQKMISLNANLRAFENNRYFIRIETTGYSKVIDNNGFIVKEIPMEKKAILNYEVPSIKDKTFYSKYLKGIDLIEFFISLFILYFFGIKNKKKK